MDLGFDVELVGVGGSCFDEFWAVGLVEGV